MDAILRPGDHVCWTFDDDIARQASTVELVLAGLAAGQKVVYCSWEAASETVLAGLHRGGLDVTAAVRVGRLDVAPAADMYLAEGRFAPEACAARWVRICEQARGDGYRSLRAIVDMTWAAGESSAVAALAGYETGANRIFLDGFASAVCQYDMRHFHPPHLREIQMAHPASLRAGRSDHTMPTLRICQHADRTLQLDGDSDLSNRTAVEACIIELCLEAATAGRRAVVDVTRLGFADVATVRFLLRAAATVPAGMTLSGCTRSFARLLLMFDSCVPSLRYTIGQH